MEDLFMALTAAMPRSPVAIVTVRVVIEDCLTEAAEAALVLAEGVTMALHGDEGERWAIVLTADARAQARASVASKHAATTWALEASRAAAQEAF